MKKILLSLLVLFAITSYAFGISINISGYALSPSSTSIDGVYVLLTGSGAYSKSMYTTYTGSYSFTLFPGTYTITTTKAGYRFSPPNFSLAVSTFATSNLYKNFFGVNTGGAEYYKLVYDPATGIATIYLKGNINVGFSTSTPNIVIDSSGVVHWADGSTSTTSASGGGNFTNPATVPLDMNNYGIFNATVVYIIGASTINQSYAAPTDTIDFQKTGIVLKPGYDNDTNVRALSGITWIGDEKASGLVNGTAGIYFFKTSTGDANISMWLGGIEVFRLNGLKEWHIVLSSHTGNFYPEYLIEDGFKSKKYFSIHDETGGPTENYVMTTSCPFIVDSGSAGYRSHPTYFGDTSFVDKKYVDDNTGASAPTVFIAAYNATTAERNSADYVCDGTNDDVQWIQALTYLNSLPSSGNLEASEGQFNFGAANIDVSSNTHIHGQGYATYLVNPINGVLFRSTSGGKNITISNMRFNTVREAFISNGTCDNIRIEDNIIEAGYGLRLANNNSTNCWIKNNYLTAAAVALRVDPSGGNYADGIHIIGNSIADGIQLGNVRYSEVTGNIIVNSINQYEIYIQNCQQMTIGNNILYGGVNYGLYMDNLTNSTVVNNQASGNGTANAYYFGGTGVKDTGNSWSVSPLLIDGSNSMTGAFLPAQKTLSELKALVPTALGETWQCSDDSYEFYSATGTTYSGQFRKASDKTKGPGQ